MNKVILMGRLGDDAKVSVFDNGNKVTKFSVATTEKYKDKSDTSWHNVDIWGGYGETVSKYLTKGKQVLIEGRIQYSKSKKGDVDTYFTTIVADKIELLGSGSTNMDLSENSQDSDDSDINNVKTTLRTPKTASKAASNDTDDDLPF